VITDAYSKLVAGDVTPIEAAAKRSNRGATQRPDDMPAGVCN